MNDYEAKVEARRERYLARAEKARQESDAQYGRSRQVLDHIPFGQPILVGHHSERGHRAALKRAHRAMDRSCEESSKAEYYEHRAAAVGKAGISSDNPEAINLLQRKLASLESQRDQARAINAYWRKHRSMSGFPGLSDEAAARIDAKMKAQNESGASWVSDKHKVYPGYYFQNLGANIRRIKERIVQLETNEGRESSEREIAGVRLVENVELNRVQLIFPDKPSAEIRQQLKRAGFRWSPNEDAWQRHLNESGKYAAERVLEALRG